MKIRCKLGWHRWSEPEVGFIATCWLCGGVRRTGDYRTRYDPCFSCKGACGDAYSGPCSDCYGTGVSL